ncbi:Crp/Fnr family transcriptional regulator [Flavobacterium sp. WLB]|uniref:Crp/Fnr family transcriptional regulator n=1 Tax=unclassified Flavobacterium TaxID=196869 RepID=UPI0006ABE6D1|nr:MULTISPECIES: Crp/Fnr family transcriptional regulator [unclassified Flavobacterium]KOP39849.1 cyclic nucleotide-binding protein [Flavobacterium sp. VMW]OWU92639.1 cyclic nucleotide-binding protein [Flavobacterium sp. NLM]PUU68446.1 Crp/Fnr family transcriptional regulator [Flavobacterium sp. WLB]
MNPHELLFNHIKRFTTLSPDQEQLLLSKLKYRKVNRKDFLLKEYEVCSCYYFVTKGCLRFYRNTENGFEQILQFAIPGWWLSDFQSFETQKPSEYFIQAVQNTEMLILQRSDYQELFTEVPVLNTYFRLMMQKAYTASLKKMELILCESAEERYLQFINSFPDFVQIVPQYMLASFLGFTPQFMSMLRAKKEL